WWRGCGWAGSTCPRWGRRTPGCGPPCGSGGRCTSFPQPPGTRRHDDKTACFISVRNIDPADGAGEGGVHVNFRIESKTLRMERPLGAATQQTAADASLELPAGLPDIARIVRVEAYPIVTDVDPLDNQVAVAGAIDVVLLYAHEEEVPVAASPIGDIEAEAAYGEAEGLDEDLPATEAREVLYRHRWRRAAPFEAAVEIPGVHPGAVVEVTAASAGVEAALRPDGRGIDVEAVVAVAARASEEQTATVPVPR